ncbi:MAG: type II toxin-antitoxin system RelB/DinJ family antitoxin [Magnetococcales bacterium]|nr:type II toxin-antitoxin system RelB/DinJ family antitoxin [Magnetococcales bacterium]
MAKTEMIRARVEPDLKHNAEAVFSILGLSPTEAITLFYKQVALQNGLPFDVKIPNATTLEAIRQARDEDDVLEYASLDELKAEFR